MRLASIVAILCMAGLTAVVDGTSPADARAARRSERHTQSNAGGTPRLAVIALAQQRISVYGASGKIIEAPVSTGATGYETPAGIYSILEKEEDHHSNLYDDASMPFMERLTWTGMAMHAGALPGYPASHGCTRLSYGFAQQLYQVTKPGMRVVVVRDDITPVDVEQPELFDQASEASPFEMNTPGSPNETEIGARLQTIKEEKQADAETAKKHELEARSVAPKKAREAAAATRLIETAQANLAQTEAKFAALKAMPETVSGRTDKSETVRAQAAAKIEAAQLQLEAAKAQAQSKMNAATQAKAEARAAAAALSEAAQAAEIARENAWPISIFISRKTQRVYIRRGREPVFEGPVTIRDPDKPIGTFVFTALSYTETPGRLRWNIVSMYKNATEIEPYSKHGSKKHRPPEPADIVGARTAMQRLVVPQEAVAHLSGFQLPGSSLIISDEGLSNETGKDTDFVVFMSGEPQGGATSRIALADRQDAHSEGKRLRKEKRRASSSSPRARAHATGAVWRNPQFSPFASFFGY
ncbi:MAG: L,D-transpeptidase family protein [Rhodomicrobium sp.]